MRIDHLLENLEVGGAEVLVTDLARLQHKQGHGVRVHGLFGGGPLAARLEAEGIPVVLHGQSHRPGIFASLCKQLRSGKVQALHCHNTMATLLGGPAGRLAGASSIISTRHGTVNANIRVERRFWWAMSLCNWAVAVSDAARRDLLTYAGARPRQLITIHNGAAAPSTEPAPDAKLHKPGFTLITVGRFATQKDFPSLLEAFATARQSVPDLYLWIVGDGAERPKMEQVIEKRAIAPYVTLMGMRKDVGYWLSQADLYVMSSVSEGLPIALLEAMAVGLPILVTDAGGMAEVVAKSGGGEVVPRGQPDLLAAKLVEMVGQRQSLVARGEANRKCYQQHFTLERMAERYLALYENRPPAL